MGVPPRIAGSVSTGSASRVPTWSDVDAASAGADSLTPTPARRNISTVNAVAVAPPPGTTLPTAFPASCTEATTNQLFTRSATRSSSQSEAKHAPSLASASAAQYHVRWPRDRQEEKTATRLG